MPRPKPLITANQVTLARLVLLPIGCWLLYQGVRGQVVALVFMTLVGCTDFVDGYLARKHGATVLGGLMDPIADKVFIAVTFLPMIELRWVPTHIVLLLFLREFLITAARTAYSRRSVPLKTSYLAKVKTWYQMIASGLIFLLRISFPTMKAVTLGGMIGPGLIGLLVAYLITRRIWKGGVVFALSFGVLFASTMLFSPEQLSAGLGWVTVAITWASGGAYLVGLRHLAGTKPPDGHDVVRMFGAAALPVLACLIIGTHSTPSWPLIITVALEFAVGGLDNLLAHHDLLPSWQGWAARVVPQAGLLGAALLLAHRGDAHRSLVELLTLATLCVTAISVAIAFYRSRSVYLGERANAPLAAPAAGQS